MAKNKYYPIRIRDEKERETLDEFLNLCKKNNSDGSTEIRKFMKRYISRHKTKDIDGLQDSKVIKSKEKRNINKNKQNESSRIQEYLDKIGYRPSYLKKKNNA